MLKYKDININFLLKYKDINAGFFAKIQRFAYSAPDRLDRKSVGRERV